MLAICGCEICVCRNVTPDRFQLCGLCITGRHSKVTRQRKYVSRMPIPVDLSKQMELQFMEKSEDKLCKS